MIQQVARVLKRVQDGLVDLRDIGMLLGEGFDQDFPRALLEAALRKANSGEAAAKALPERIPPAVSKILIAASNHGLVADQDVWDAIRQALAKGETNG